MPKHTTHFHDCGCKSAEYEAQIAALNQQLAAVEARNRTLSAEVEEIKEKYRKMHDTLNREQLCSWMFVDDIDRRYGEIKQGKNGEYSWEPRQAGVMDADDLLALACFMKRKEGKPLPTERRAKIEALEDVLASIDGPIGMTAEAFIEGKLKELKAGAENE